VLLIFWALQHLYIQLEIFTARPLSQEVILVWTRVTASRWSVKTIRSRARGDVPTFK
jgi:hypothetical protein